MKNIDVKELITAMEELEKEKGIKKDYLIESLEAALVTAYKRNFDSADNVSVEINQTTGDVHIYSIKKVVDKVSLLYKSVIIGVTGILVITILFILYFLRAAKYSSTVFITGYLV